jgi:hypothetical protein
MYLSVCDRLVLDLLTESRLRGSKPLALMPVKAALKGLLGGGYVSASLTRLVGLGAVVKTTKGGVRYTARVPEATDLLIDPAGMVDADVYIYIVAAHEPGRPYVDRDEIADVFGDIADHDLGAALVRLQAEKLVTRASFTENRYFPSFCDGVREERLVTMLHNLEGYFDEHPEWVLDLVGLPQPVALGPRGRLSPLAAV